MKAIIGETQVRVHEYKGKEVGDYLYTGTYMGMGIINLGLNGQTQGVIVLAPVDDETAQCSVVSFKQAFFEIGG